MSQPHDPHDSTSTPAHPATHSAHSPARPHATPGLARVSTLFQIGAGLGIAGFSIGLMIFLTACFGFGAALVLSPLPLIMGAVGLVLTVAGGLKDPQIDGSQVAASLFINVGAIAGGLLEIAAWQGWRIFV